MTVANLLRYGRTEKAKMTQIQVTMKTGIPQAQLSDYEHGRMMPSAERALKLMDLYGLLDLTEIEKEVEDSGQAKGLYSAMAA